MPKLITADCPPPGRRRRSRIRRAAGAVLVAIGAQLLGFIPENIPPDAIPWALIAIGAKLLLRFPRVELVTLVMRIRR